MPAWLSDTLKGGWGRWPSCLVVSLSLLGGQGVALGGPARPAGDLDAGIAAAARADWDTAIDRLHAAVQARPADPRARRELGTVYLRAAQAGTDPALRRVMLAMADLELGQAVRLDPRDAAAKRAWAENAVLSGNLDRAIRLYEELLAARGRGDDRDAAQLVTLYLALPRIERGLYTLGEKLREQPAWQELRYLLAILYQRGGNSAEAASLLRQVAGAGKASPQLRRLAGETLRGMGQ